MSGIGITRIPFSGPKEADLYIVGEAPGGEEAARGQPFIGSAGEVLLKYLARHGKNRDDVRLTNLCKYRPPGNKFEALLKSSELQEGLGELAEEINKHKPNAILALGNWPTYFLTGQSGKKKGSGISYLRGSILPAVAPFDEGLKVICTYHPSFLTRTYNQKWRPVFNCDVKRAVEDSEFPELRHPEYASLIDPTQDTLTTLTQEAIASDWISLDIETFPNNTFSCVGFGWEHEGELKGVCVTYKSPVLWRFVKEVWESDTPKIFQYGTYDIPFMQRFYGWSIGGYYEGKGWDTYVASASIYPDYPRKLDFMTSLYTRFPYYKEERKVWKQEGDQNILWEYNLKDVIATHQIAMIQMEEIKELFG